MLGAAGSPAWLLVPAALLLDAALGDPSWPGHPVRAMGALAAFAERRARLLLRPLAAGAVAWASVVAASAGFALGLLAALAAAGRAMADLAGGDPEAGADLGRGIAAVLLVYASIAPRDLAAHALRVRRSLRSGGLGAGREAVSMIVGRDVERLDEAGVARAAVESVAESAVDGVLAPLFWAFVLGPAGAFAYRAINTMDSMFGYRSERYILFGRVAARADDAANWLPARLSLPCIAAAAALAGLSPRGALRTGLRDHAKHESPNAAWPEAAFAGALGIELGGPAWYGGELLEKPKLGEGLGRAGEGDIGRAVLLMYAATAVFAAAGSGLAWSLRLLLR